MTTRAHLIAVDWGTTSCRASLLDTRGNAIARLGDAPGILAVQDRGFADALAALVGPWRAARGAVPILLSGMIGSRQGWKETLYVPSPAGLSEIAGGLLSLQTAELGEVHIVPGLDTANAGVPDVMRGEETQVFGSGVVDGLCVLPGTHSKWVVVECGRIVRFATYMTGEVYAALRGHTILGRLMSDSAPASSRDISDTFLSGVKSGAKAGGPGALLHRIFSVRTLGLFDRVPSDALADHLSGLLIGAEIADAAHGTKRLISVIANEDLGRRYVAAAQALDLMAHAAPPTCAERGAFAIAKAAGIVAASA
jgi:2-dehydro-3-deoxygalactonokinase